MTKIALPTIIPTATLTATPYIPATPTIIPTPTACAEPVGEVVSTDFYSNLLGELVPALVYLPPCYDMNPETSYPLLLMLHGQYGDQFTWQELGLTDTADRLIREGQIPPLVIVMPFEKDMWVDAGDSVFQSVLTIEFFPVILEEFRISNDPALRAIGGYSRGANWAVRIGFMNPGFFGAVGAHSYPTFAGDTARLSGWVADLQIEQYPRLLIDLGEDDVFLQYASAFETELTRLEVPHDYVLQPGTHSYDYWEAHITDYLIWYAAGWKNEN